MNEFVRVDVDNLLLFSKDKGGHYKHLETDFDNLRENQLYACLTNCKFLKEEIDSLSMLVCKKSINADLEKVEKRARIVKVEIRYGYFKLNWTVVIISTIYL